MLLKDSPLYWEGSLDLKRGNRQERPAWMDLRAAEPHVEEGTVYRPKQAYISPSRNSKMVLSTVK